jgi:hypothetical protein
VSIERDHWIASAWGLAEATLFFFVPDVFLTWVALEHPRRAFVACGFALAGALVGGAAMFAWGSVDAQSVRATLDAVPGIRPDMIAAVREDLQEHGPIALFTGPPRGVPYKIYASEWGALGGGLVGFLLQSVPARGLRFLLTAAIASLLRRHVLGKLSRRACQAIHVALWLAFYAGYFYVMRD